MHAENKKIYIYIFFFVVWILAFLVNCNKG